MSDSDDSDDSELPFDVEIEKYEKRLQLARYKKKYRNAWGYVTNRWQKEHIHIVLKEIEEWWSFEEKQNVSNTFRYLEEIYAYYLDGIADVDGPNDTVWIYSLQITLELNVFGFAENGDEIGTAERKGDKKQLQLWQKRLRRNFKDVTNYMEFFEEVAEVNYGREARAIYDGGMHDSTMRNARTRYGRKPEINTQFIFNNFSSSRSVGQLKLKFSNVFSKLVPGEPASRKIEAPDIYTLECMKIAYGGICRYHHLPYDIWNKQILPLLFRQQTLDNFNERCKVARELKKIEDALRNFRLGYADHYAEERREHKFLFDVYKHFMRKLHSLHDKLEDKVKRRLAQMDELLEKFKALPSGGKLVLSSMEDHLPIPAYERSIPEGLFDENDFDDFIEE